MGEKEKVQKIREVVEAVGGNITDLAEAETVLEEEVARIDDNVDTLNATVVEVSEREENIQEDVEGLEGDVIRLEVDVSKVSRSLELLEDKVENLNVTTTKKLAVCGYQEYYWNTDAAVITYDSIVAEVNEFGGKPLDISSGKFTAPITGLYEVSAAAERCYVPGDGADQYVDLYMNDNDRRLERFMNQYKLDSGGMATPCSGFRYVQLDEGDNLYLKYGGGSAILGLKFCITLYTTTE